MTYFIINKNISRQFFSTHRKYIVQFMKYYKIKTKFKWNLTYHLIINYTIFNCLHVLLLILIKHITVFTYHSTQFPQAIAMDEFQPYTATGKLNAVITPTSPRGFHCSNSM